MQHNIIKNVPDFDTQDETDLVLPQQGQDTPVAPEEVLLRQRGNQINVRLTAFAFEHSLSTSHPQHEGNNSESKSSSNYAGESGSHSWWASEAF